MTVSVIRGVRPAVKRALAASAMAACGAGCLAAYGQQAAATQAAGVQTTTAPVTATRSKVTAAKAAPVRKRIVLAQTTPPPANANPSGDQQLQTIVITGSLIARTSVETPNPVQIISAKDLASSGYTDISDILRNISANGANTLSQSFSFAFAIGGSGISLRGLTLGDTLVLIDGERSVPFPLLDDNQRSFVDLSSIPFTAVQQVQIQKDGGSALYGSDAIAGVVNVILRKQYQGFHVTTEAGTSSHWDGTMEHIGFIGGHGDLAADGYNWYLSGDFRHQDPILAKDRSGQWDSIDFSSLGGFNRTPGAPEAESPFPYPATLTGYLINPNTASGQPYAYLPGCDQTSQDLGRCEFKPAGAQLQPADSNIDLLGKLTKELGGGWEFGLQASWFDSKSEQVTSYLGDGTYGGGTGYATGGINQIGLLPGQPPNSVVFPLITVPANYPGNPFGVPAPLMYDFPEFGLTSNQVETNTYRLLVSLTGNAAGWQINGTAGAMYSKMALTAYDALEPAAFQNALNNGYILGSPNGASLFAPPAETTPTSQLDLIDIHGTHELFEMPGGPLNLAVGVQWFKELHDETPPTLAGEGSQSLDSIYVIGTEYDRAGFVELDGNPIKQLEIDAQARYDNYQTFGSDTTPKIGLKFTPWKWVALRGTWGKGFRAPSAAEGISSGEAFGEGTIADPVLCPNPGNVDAPGNFPSTCTFPGTGVLQANPHLKDVTSTNWTMGIVLQPIQRVSATADYYNIKVTNDIVGANSLSGGFSSYVRGPIVTLPYCPASSSGPCTSAELVPTTTPVGTILFSSFPYLNASATEVSGYDVDLTYRWDAGAFGRFTGDASWTHELTYKLLLNGHTYELAGTHGPAGVSGDTGNPKDKINVRLSWTRGALTVTPSMSYISHFSITDPSTGTQASTCAEALAYDANFPGGVTPQNEQFCTVRYFLETDLYASYQVSAALEVHAAVTNLFNKNPPVDVMTYGSGSMFYPYDAALEQDGAVGRFMTVGINYDF
ncbi:MAG TPA: TonB-dependent receptor [Steroidobacteraceae bacterium]|nr:TonB-dependent receptor [Steroidobacteraceae bacterium]